MNRNSVRVAWALLIAGLLWPAGVAAEDPAVKVGQGEPMIRPGLKGIETGEPGAAVNGLKLTLSADETDLQLTELRLRRAKADAPRFGCTGTRLTLTLSNVGKTPIKVSRYDFEFQRLHLLVSGPRPGSVRVRDLAPLMDRDMPAPAEKDYPTIEPGESLAIRTFGRFPGQLGAMNYLLLAPGQYKLKAVYLNRAMPRAEVAKFAAGQWTGAVTSNELKLAAFSPPVESPVLNDLKLSLSVVSHESAVGEAIRYRVALTNVGTKELLVLPLLQPQATLLLTVTDPAGQAVRYRGPMLDWDVPDYDKVVKALAPGESIARALTLGGFDMSRPGKYKLTVTYDWPNARPPPGRKPADWKRDPIWTGKLPATLELTVKPKQKQEAAGGDGKQGINGLVVKLKGNFMPGPGPRPGAGKTPLSVPVHIFKGTVATFKQPKPDHPQLVQIVQSDKAGRFKVALGPGDYTVVAVIGGRMYLNIMQMDPKTRRAVWPTVKVQAGKWADWTIEETSQAAF